MVFADPLGPCGSPTACATSRLSFLVLAFSVLAGFICRALGRWISYLGFSGRPGGSATLGVRRQRFVSKSNRSIKSRRFQLRYVQVPGVRTCPSKPGRAEMKRWFAALIMLGLICSVALPALAQSRASRKRTAYNREAAAYQAAMTQLIQR